MLTFFLISRDTNIMLRMLKGHDAILI